MQARACRDRPCDDSALPGPKILERKILLGGDHEITRGGRCCSATPRFSSVSTPPTPLPKMQIPAVRCNPVAVRYTLGWRIPNHFAGCSNFEQSLPKMVTKRKRWSTSAGSGWPQGRSLVVQVSGGALARTSSVNPSIKIKSNFRGNRVDTIFRAGLLALLFFCFGADLALLLAFEML
jgi:hypothetical protein